jgi:hypothetical protein
MQEHLNVSDLKDVLEQYDRERCDSLQKLRVRQHTSSILDREGFVAALAHLKRCQDHGSGLMLPVTEARLAAHFGFDVATTGWVRALPVYEGYLCTALKHIGLLHALLAVTDHERAPLSVTKLSITFFEGGKRATLVQGSGFVAGCLMGLIRGLEAGDGDPEQDAFTLPLKLELPSTAYLCAYKTGAVWDGPEEGGCTYEAGELVEAWTTTPTTYAAQRALMQQLIDGEHMDADLIEHHYRAPPAGWPNVRTRYC